jgi:hypothetical protein
MNFLLRASECKRDWLFLMIMILSIPIVIMGVQHRINPNAAVSLIFWHFNQKDYNLVQTAGAVIVCYLVIIRMILSNFFPIFPREVGQWWYIQPNGSLTMIDKPAFGSFPNLDHVVKIVPGQVTRQIEFPKIQQKLNVAFAIDSIPDSSTAQQIYLLESGLHDLFEKATTSDDQATLADHLRQLAKRQDLPVKISIS